MSHFRPCDRDTPYLLPPSLDDWLPRDHLARFVADIVDQLDLSAVKTGNITKRSGNVQVVTRSDLERG